MTVSNLKSSCRVCGHPVGAHDGPAGSGACMFGHEGSVLPEEGAGPPCECKKFERRKLWGSVYELRMPQMREPESRQHVLSGDLGTCPKCEGEGYYPTQGKEGPELHLCGVCEGHGVLVIKDVEPTEASGWSKASDLALAKVVAAEERR